MSDVTLSEAANEARLIHIRERLAAYRPAPVYDVTNRAVEDMRWLVGIVDDLAARLSQEREQRDRLQTAIQAVRDLHPKIENPRHGCCAAPKLCKGHEPECRASEHHLGGVRWPCATLRALDAALAQDGPRPAQEGER